MRIERQFDGCDAERRLMPWTAPHWARFCKGNTSSQTNPVTINANTAAQGGTGAGTPAGAQGAIVDTGEGNADTSVGAGGVYAPVLIGSPVTSSINAPNYGPPLPPPPPPRGSSSTGTASTASNSTINSNNTTTSVVQNIYDPAAALAAIQAVQNVSGNAIGAAQNLAATNATLSAVAIGNATDLATTTIESEQSQENAAFSLVNNVANNFATVVSQAVAAFTNHAPATAVGASPAPMYNYVVPAGTNETAQDSNAINASAANAAPAGDNGTSSSGLSGTEIALIVGGIAIAGALIVFLHK